MLGQGILPSCCRRVPTSSDGALHGTEAPFSRLASQLYCLLVTTGGVVDPQAALSHPRKQSVRAQHNLQNGGQIGCKRECQSEGRVGGGAWGPEVPCILVGDAVKPRPGRSA